MLSSHGQLRQPMMVNRGWHINTIVTIPGHRLADELVSMGRHPVRELKLLLTVKNT
jgi:hypothetical protein